MPLPLGSCLPPIYKYTVYCELLIHLLGVRHDSGQQGGNGEEGMNGTPGTNPSFLSGSTKSAYHQKTIFKTDLLLQLLGHH